MRSRAKTSIKKQNKKAIIGIILIIALLGFFGTKLLIGLSSVIVFFQGSNDTSIETTTVDYIAPPVIDPLPAATKEETIDITGYSPGEASAVALYVNGKKVEKTSLKEGNIFTFLSVSLSKGENDIEARSIMKNGDESNFSKIVKIKYLNDPPKLEIQEPSDGQKFKKDQSPITVSGQSDQGVKVTVNGFWAISDNDGKFTYAYNLKDDNNTLRIVATDEAGNETLKEIRVEIE